MKPVNLDLTYTNFISKSSTNVSNKSSFEDDSSNIKTIDCFIYKDEIIKVWMQLNRKFSKPDVFRFNFINWWKISNICKPLDCNSFINKLQIFYEIKRNIKRQIVTT